jgi:nucleoside-diphosphate-sugar epimerase
LIGPSEACDELFTEGRLSAARGVPHVKFVITGATGYVGRNLVPLLQESGADLLLAGRDKAKISRVFPGCIYCDYTELAETAKGYTVLLHLAVLNNTSSEPLETFLKVNVDGALETAKLAREAGIETFVNFSSTHALDQSNTSPYAISKRNAADELAKIEGMRIINLYLPYVYNPDFSDRLTFLSKLPSPLARIGPSARSLRSNPPFRFTGSLRWSGPWTAGILPCTWPNRPSSATANPAIRSMA